MDLGGHGVEALACAIGSCESHVHDGSADTAVSVVQRVNGYEPEVSDGGF